MKINVPDPSGLTGSVHINATAVYLSATKFTTNNLPEPYLSYDYSYAGFTIDLPEVNKPYWVMFSYTGRDGQQVYGPPVCMMELGKVETKVFGGMSALLYGDGINGMFPAILTGVDVIYPDMFKTGPSDPITFVSGNAPISWFLVNGTITGNTVKCNMTTVTAKDLYSAGYMGKPGAQAVIYSPEMHAILGGVVSQGRSKNTYNMSWSAYIPTLDEFRERFGVIFQSDIPTIALPISPFAMEPNRWYHTSTEDPNKPGFFYAISASGTVTSFKADVNCGAYLMYAGKPL